MCKETCQPFGGHYITTIELQKLQENYLNYIKCFPASEGFAPIPLKSLPYHRLCPKTPVGARLLAIDRLTPMLSKKKIGTRNQCVFLMQTYIESISVCLILIDTIRKKCYSIRYKYITFVVNVYKRYVTNVQKIPHMVVLWHFLMNVEAV